CAGSQCRPRDSLRLARPLVWNAASVVLRAAFTHSNALNKSGAEKPLAALQMVDHLSRFVYYDGHHRRGFRLCADEIQFAQQGRNLMKRVPVFLLMLLLVSTVLAAQNKNAKPARKPKAAPVDCSNVTDSKITEDVKAKLAGTKSLKDETINVATSAG